MPPRPAIATSPLAPLPLLLALASSLIGCSSGQPSSTSGETTTTSTASGGTSSGTTSGDPPPGPVTIVVLGSSTAAGFGLSDPAKSWVARYSASLDEDDPNNEVINLAVSGFTTFQVLPTGAESPGPFLDPNPDHNVTAALAQKPDAIIVNLPSNDAASKVPLDTQMANVEAIDEEARDAGVPVWFSTSQPRSLDAEGQSLLKGYREQIIAKFGDRALDFWTPIAADDGTIIPELGLGDGIHLNAEGHRLLFEVVRAANIPAALAAK